MKWSYLLDFDTLGPNQLKYFQHIRAALRTYGRPIGIFIMGKSPFLNGKSTMWCDSTHGAIAP